MIMSDIVSWLIIVIIIVIILRFLTAVRLSAITE